MASQVASKSDSLGFDPDALRARYRQERDKRVRADGNAQYQEVTGEFARYLDDPYTKREERAPLSDKVEVLIVGGGFGGLLAGARLRDAGFENIRIVERAGDFGGTWYWNRYPGAQCDIESYIYLPLLEELGVLPKEKYAYAAEIFAHSKKIAKHYELYRDVCFHTSVTAMRWCEPDNVWLVETDRGDAMRARFVIMAAGPLDRPKLPAIPGIAKFQGKTFHTSRWDYAYTGGSATTKLDRLADKKIGIIGTGATAIQCVPHLGAAAKELYVFQRTPSSVDVRGNRPTDSAWAQSLQPGWHMHRMENFNTLVSGGVTDEDLVQDGWTSIIRNLLNLAADGKASFNTEEEIAAGVELADFQKMNSIRARVDELVHDKATAAALKPWYRQFCKRPCFHDDYLPTFNRPNVTLVDTNGKGAERITAGGVVANGTEYPLDGLIFATGFEVGTAYTRRAACDLVGRGGQLLSKKWQDGMATLHGMHAHGFPNYFIFSLIQSGFTANVPHSLAEQSSHVAYILSEARARGAQVVEATPAAEDAWVQKIVDLARDQLDFLEACTPGYYNNEGRPADRGGRDAFYGGGSPEFFQLLAAWRDEGSLNGLQLS